MSDVQIVILRSNLLELLLNIFFVSTCCDNQQFLLVMVEFRRWSYFHRRLHNLQSKLLPLANVHLNIHPAKGF